MLYGASNSSNTTGSTYNLVSMQRSISLYRALKKPRVSSTSPNGILADFWYVIEDMFLDQKLLKHLLLRLVAGWPTYRDKMSGLCGAWHHEALNNSDGSPVFTRYIGRCE